MGFELTSMTQKRNQSRLCVLLVGPIAHARRIQGADVDVWYRYPEGKVPCAPSRFAVHTVDNFIMTPHISGWMEGILQYLGGMRLCKNRNSLHGTASCAFAPLLLTSDVG
jgi:hypothetical protein